MRPADPVSEFHLARSNGVSQTTVREAMVKLEHSGLIRRIHNIGTFLTQMSPREIQKRLRWPARNCRRWRCSALARTATIPTGSRPSS